MNDELKQKFKSAKQEVQQQQSTTNETKQEQSKTEEVNIKHLQEVFANKQLADIQKSLEKIAKQNETNQQRALKHMQIDLENYLDSQVVDATKRVLSQHTEKMETMQRNTYYHIKQINEKLNYLIFGLSIIFMTVLIYSVYRIYFYKLT